MVGEAKTYVRPSVDSGNTILHYRLSVEKRLRFSAGQDRSCGSPQDHAMSAEAWHEGTTKEK